MKKVNSQILSSRLYDLLNESLSVVENSLAVIKDESSGSKPNKSGVNFLAQQLLQISMTFNNLRKEERDSAKTPLASDNLSPEEMKAMLLDILTTQDLEEMLETRKQLDLDAELAGEKELDTPSEE